METEVPPWHENTKCGKCQTVMVREGMTRDSEGLIKLMVCSECGHKQRVHLG